MTNSNRKGKAGERELARELTRLFGLECRRGQQHKGGADSPDVVGIPGVHWEAKRVERLNLADAMAQAIRDAGESVPVVAHRRNRGEWLVTLRLDDLPRLAVVIFHVLTGE